MAVTEVGTPTATAYTSIAGSGSTNLTQSWSGTQPRTAGDLLWAVVTAAMGGSIESITGPSAPSGWTAASGGTITGAAGRTYVGHFWKVAAGSDAAPVFSVTGSGSSAGRGSVTLHEFSGANTTTPVDTAGTHDSGGSAVTITSVTVTTSGNVSASGELAVVGQAMATASSAATKTYTVGSGFTNFSNDGSTSTQSHNANDTKSNPTSGSTASDAASWASTTSAYASACIVVIAVSGSTPVSDSDTGAGIDAGTAGVSDSDAGTGTDTGSANAHLSDTDTGTGTETGQIGVTGTDSGVGTDNGSVTLGATDADTATGTETGSASATLSDTDTGTGTEAAQVGVTGTDSGVGTETGSIAIVVTGTDAAAGTDAAVQIGVSDSDAGAGTDTGSVHAALSAADTAAGTDSGSVTVVGLLPPAPTVPFFPAGYEPQQADFTGWWYDNAWFFQTKVVARLRQTVSSQNLPSAGSTTVIDYDTVDEDPWGGWQSLAGFGWTPKISGFYQITVTVQTVALPSTSTMLRPAVAGTFGVIGLAQILGSTSHATGAEGTFVAYMLAGTDYVQGAAAVLSAPSNVATSIAAGSQSSMEIVYLAS